MILAESACSARSNSSRICSGDMFLVECCCFNAAALIPDSLRIGSSIVYRVTRILKRDVAVCVAVIEDFSAVAVAFEPDGTVVTTLGSDSMMV